MKTLQILLSVVLIYGVVIAGYLHNETEIDYQVKEKVVENDVYSDTLKYNITELTPAEYELVYGEKIIEK